MRAIVTLVVSLMWLVCAFGQASYAASSVRQSTVYECMKQTLSAGRYTERSARRIKVDTIVQIRCPDGTSEEMSMPKGGSIWSLAAQHLEMVAAATPAVPASDPHIAKTSAPLPVARTEAKKPVTHPSPTRSAVITIHHKLSDAVSQIQPEKGPAISPLLKLIIVMVTFLVGAAAYIYMSAHRKPRTIASQTAEQPKVADEKPQTEGQGRNNIVTNSLETPAPATLATIEPIVVEEPAPQPKLGAIPPSKGDKHTLLCTLKSGAVVQVPFVLTGEMTQGDNATKYFAQGPWEEPQILLVSRGGTVTLANRPVSQFLQNDRKTSASAREWFRAQGHDLASDPVDRIELFGEAALSQVPPSELGEMSRPATMH